MKLPFDPRIIAPRLLTWYAVQGRDLPWRYNCRPYNVWISEIMLQQTTVAAVIPYYEKFLKKFPTLASLAGAPLDAVLETWVGLGYYSRARNLHKAARIIMSDHKGEFPQTLESLLSLPGIGRSTAGAILSIAFNQPAPILDGNVRRVLVRLFAWKDDPRSSQAEKQLWSWAEIMTSHEQPHDYAQAIMDLGATVCTPREPLCHHCPLAEFCQAFALGLEGHLPLKQQKQALQVRYEAALLLRNSDSFLVRQRPHNGFLGGLWEFPVTSRADGADSIPEARSLMVSLGLQGQLAKIDVIRHVYSHFKLELAVFFATVQEANPAKRAGYTWASDTELLNIPLHGAHRKALEMILEKS